MPAMPGPAWEGRGAETEFAGYMECPICNDADEDTEWHVLSCGHFACATCMTQFLNANQHQAGPKPPCFVCQAVDAWPKAGPVRLFVPNQRRLPADLVEEVEKLRAERELKTALDQAGIRTLKDLQAWQQATHEREQEVARLDHKVAMLHQQLLTSLAQAPMAGAAAHIRCAPARLPRPSVTLLDTWILNFTQVWALPVVRYAVLVEVVGYMWSRGWALTSCTGFGTEKPLVCDVMASLFEPGTLTARGMALVLCALPREMTLGLCALLVLKWRWLNSLQP